MELLREIALLQKAYKNLKITNRLSKKAICELVIPFRDKYGLTDMHALSIARAGISLDKIVSILEAAGVR